MTQRSVTVPADTEIRGEIEFRNLTFAYDYQSKLSNRSTATLRSPRRSNTARPSCTM